MGSTYTFLPDGRPIFPPVNPTWWSEGDHVTFDTLNYYMGQAGAFLAAKPIYQGLGTTSTSITTGIGVSVAFQTDIADSANGHNPGTNNTQYVFPETGNGSGTTTVGDYYLCIGYIPYSSNDANSVYEANIYSHSSPGTEVAGISAPGNGAHALTALVVELVSATGQTSGGPFVTLEAYVAGSTASSTATGSKIPSLTVMWVGGSWIWTPLQSPVSSPHTWVDADEATANATGLSSQTGGQKVPLNIEVVQNTAFHTSPPTFRANSYTSGTAATAVTDAWTSIPLPSMDIDNFGGWSSSANTRYTVKQAGLYLVSGTVAWIEAVSPTGYRICRLRVNGDNTQVYGGNTFQVTAGCASRRISNVAVAMIQLNAGDYLELQFSHNQGSSLTLDSNGFSFMLAVWQSL